ncbi:hypothetical protein [Wolbachia pipientis]|uniref:hypothetical protein n=1 Tax=Wolbachia pipientis TaxID=955 RepID=UPI0025A47B0B|nr:hypothetical protein [Wolbachia pipientis]MDM8335326.1 hypothetical protein [Wolbachia pipientis]
MKNCEPLKNSGNSKEHLSSTVAENSYKQGSQGLITSEVLTEQLKKIKEKSGNKKGGDSSCSSVYSSGLEGNVKLLQQSTTNPATKMDGITPVSSKAKNVLLE